eukprot:scaffold23080_cov75-Skeletonema_dohrnii-CCMP3373.AAC.2
MRSNPLAVTSLAWTVTSHYVLETNNPQNQRRRQQGASVDCCCWEDAAMVKDIDKLPNVPKFLRRGGNSSSGQDDDSASASDYHRYSSDQAAENDVLHTAVNGALNTLNSVNDDTVESTRTPTIRVSLVPCTPQSDDPGKEVELNATGHEVKQSHQKHVHGAENNTYEKADDDSSGAWWNLLSNKGSFDTTSVAVSPVKEPAASNYIKKEKMLRKKAFNRAALGGSIQFDHTLSDESSPT